MLLGSYLLRCTTTSNSSIIPRQRAAAALISRNFFSTEARDAMEYDVVMVGAGPASLAAAIRLKQQCAIEGNPDLSVCIVEKGASVGSHILSGNVFEPRALNELLPEWQSDAPEELTSTPVKSDAFHILTSKKKFTLPNMLLPPEQHNEGNFIISLGQMTRYLASVAEDLGVEIYPGFSASEVLYNEKGAVAGIATKDMGIDKDGSHKSSFARGMELRARVTLFGEGCRGSCSEEVMTKFNLREGVQPQTYGLGIKEVWKVPNAVPGTVHHTLGWPLQQKAFDKTFGGSFIYHSEPDVIQLGLVVGLDYENPYLNPYNEFQRFKTHPFVAEQLKGGECVSYGARVLNEGGYHAIPKLEFPGGALIGCSAGFLNSVKIKGSHTAMKSGMVAADAIVEALRGKETVGDNGGEINTSEDSVTLSTYRSMLDDSWVMEELKKVRNCHASFHSGTLPGLIYSGISTHVLKGREPWTIQNSKKDSEKTKKASEFQPISYPKPDGVLTFDLLSNLQKSGTNHEDQPSHLVVKDELKDSITDLYETYGAPETRFCPARVYEYTDGSEHESKKPQLVINSQNCVHCKCCSIKMPSEYIKWTVPEGGGGPAYEVM